MCYGYLKGLGNIELCWSYEVRIIKVLYKDMQSVLHNLRELRALVFEIVF